MTEPPQTDDPNELYDWQIAHPEPIDPHAEAVEKAQRELDARETAAFWAGVYGDKAGRREMWRLFDLAGTFRNEYRYAPAGTSNHFATEFYRGQKEFGLRLYMARQVDCWDGLRKMHEENDPRMAQVTDE